jgi:hypothetical protein
MRKFCKVAIATSAAVAALQCIRPGIPVRPASAEIQAPAQVRQILEKSCYSCHSDQRRLAWFDQIVPVYWLARRDVLTAREHLNFSTLGSKPAAAQKAALYEAVNMIQLGAMPLPAFTKVHPEARVTPEDLATLQAYLSPWPSIPDRSESTLSNSRKTASYSSHLSAGEARQSLLSVRTGLNGIPFDPDFENWKLLSTTERGDNHTLRFILGNDIAIKAAQSGNISPWPDGTRFAKIAWQEEHGSDGLIYPGDFYQVEFMLKESSAYRATEGWGWGRWRGPDLKPYGANADFVRECTGCHKPVRGNDYVYTLPITTAHSQGFELLNNRAASLPPILPWQPLQWSAVTMFIDPSDRTSATLYANRIAESALHPPVDAAEPPAYPEGAVLALVTWAQRDDPHWFGARIPDMPRSVEFVQIGRDGKPYGYRRFDGLDLAESHPQVMMAAQRMNFIITLHPASLP